MVRHLHIVRTLVGVRGEMDEREDCNRILGLLASCNISY